MTINTHMILWNVYPETTEAERTAQAADYFAMGAVPEVQGQLHGRRIDDDRFGPAGRWQANPNRPRSLANFDPLPLGQPWDYLFAIEFPDPAAESESRYNPHRAHLDFAWRNCRTIWSDFIHQDFVTETTTATHESPDRRIIHVDCWTFWPDADADAVDRQCSALLGLAGSVPGISRVRVGRRDPTRPRGATMIGDRNEIGIRNTAPWHFHQAGGQYDGYAQIEFTDIDAAANYLTGSSRVEFVKTVAVPLWSDYLSQQFERIPPP